ncbi:hypothetical protein SS1G_06553 [Sclerotinia sclerotiorum 1980 UF-70]|uniref:Uncharacterized protein n=1 Tax=Sclerotinia sclerotiorum (strain ATCC 18683 / 1980 / Ss-1) TaxID=665079 RepID=A7EMK5_SCLS1|nr:hypothetical protein SS1G_06553 [Sclerotinia sclerotiorum 1980 UF-70]EDO04071.1 hypothetical protein SS1G_06553 [Sclerotinia sclerotiorum 1980 UF-70]
MSTCGPNLSQAMAFDLTANNTHVSEVGNGFQVQIIRIKFHLNIVPLRQNVRLSVWRHCGIRASKVKAPTFQ